MGKQQRKLLTICIWCAIIVFVIRCMISWGNIISEPSLYDLFGYASESISISFLFLGLYEKWLWRFNPFEKTPKLSKQYVGILKSNYDQRERTATLKIRQTLSSIHVTLITDQSKSESISASIEDVLGETRLVYCYINTPRSEFRAQSQIHYGTASFSIQNSLVLEGQYYTDRATTGDMKFKVE